MNIARAAAAAETPGPRVRGIGDTTAVHPKDPDRSARYPRRSRSTTGPLSTRRLPRRCEGGCRPEHRPDADRPGEPAPGLLAETAAACRPRANGVSDPRRRAILRPPQAAPWSES